ncbi:FadR/GntR family transcriptional regulator [Lactobacillaceae bacterium Scapto_B20]
MAKLSPSLGTIATQKINDYIKDHQLKPGDKLPTEPELMKYCDVSRSTIREAIQRLKYSGVVTVKQGSGTYVNQPVEIKVNNPLLRKNIKMIEHEVIDELIDDDVDPNEWVILKAMLARRNQLLQQQKFAKFIDVDVEFHTKIVDLADNEYLSKWYRELLPLWVIHLNEMIKKQPDFEKNIQYHNQLFDALLNRNRQVAFEMIDRVGKQI